MTAREAFLGALMLAAGGLALVSNSARSEHLARADSLEAVLEVRDTLLEAERQRARLLEASAEVARAEAAAVTERVNALVVENVRSFEAAGDTVRIIVQDPIVLELIDRRDSIFAATLEAKDSVIVAVTARAEAAEASALQWQMVATETDSLRQLERRINAELREAIDDARPGLLPTKRDLIYTGLGAVACLFWCPG